MRILLFSNGRNCPQSSYGKHAGILCDLWKSLGHDVAMLGYPGVQGGGVVIDNTITFPATDDYYSQNSVSFRAAQWNADLIVSFMDTFVLRPEQYPQFRHVCYFPVDTDKIGPRSHEVLLQAWDRVSFAPYGKEKANQAGLSSGYIPLAVDTTTYRPLPQAECRDVFGLPADAFIFGVVAANKEGFPSRKGWHELFEAYAIFLSKNPDTNTLLYIHSRSGGGGVNFERLAELFGIPQSKWRVTQIEKMIDGLPEAAMPVLYNCFDVLVSASKGEGFGLPLAEAQACGVPVICGAWTAQKDVAYAGVSVPEVYATLEPVFDPSGCHEFCHRYRMNPAALAQAMGELYGMDGETFAYHKSCARRAMESEFSVERVREAWNQQFAEWQARIARETHAQSREKIDLAGTFDESVHKAQVNEADCVIVCPSYGHQCGIAGYTGYQVWEFFQHGIKAHVATTIAEAIQVARRCESVKSIILHHEYSFFSEGGQYYKGEDILLGLRHLKHLADELPHLKVSMIQHSVATTPDYHAMNCSMAAEGVKIFATSVKGAAFLSSQTNRPMGHAALGAWTVPGWKSCPPGAKDGAPFIIGNFGMLWPSRNIPQQIELCQKTGSFFFGSFANKHEQYRQEVEKLLKESGVTYSLQTDWPDDIELMHRLSHCDLLYMPRVSSVFYSSSSVVTAMNAGRPIIANNDFGYADLADVICLAESPDEAAKWVEKLRDPAQYQAAVLRIQRYLRDRNVTKVYREAGIL